MSASSSQVALARLAEERKAWRKDHPPDWIARPMNRADKSTDLMRWEGAITGRKGTDWEGGLYKLVIHFSDAYPVSPPAVMFKPPIYHPNVYSDVSTYTFFSLCQAP